MEIVRICVAELDSTLMTVYEERIFVTHDFYQLMVGFGIEMNLLMPKLNATENNYMLAIDYKILDENEIIHTSADELYSYNHDVFDILQNQCKDFGLDLKSDTKIAKEFIEAIRHEEDYYLFERNCYERLRYEFMKYGKLIFCVDYDDTLYDFHRLGRTYDDVINLLKRWEKYSEVIIFTGNGEEKYPEIETYLNDKGVKFKGINCDNSVAVDGRKVYANAYIDDRGGLPVMYSILNRLITEIENGDVVHE